MLRFGYLWEDELGKECHIHYCCSVVYSFWAVEAKDGKANRSWILMDFACCAKASRSFQAGFNMIRLAFEEEDRWLC